MRFKEIDRGTIGKIRRPRYKLEAELTEFMNMKVLAAEVSYGPHDYVNAESCRKSLYQAARRYNFPIRIIVIGGKVYLMRTDM